MKVEVQYHVFLLTRRLCALIRGFGKLWKARRLLDGQDWRTEKDYHQRDLEDLVDIRINVNSTRISIGRLRVHLSGC